MSQLACFPDGSVSQMKELVKEVRDVSELKKVWCVLLGALGMNSGEIAPLVGYHQSHVKLTWAKYREKGESAFTRPKEKGHRNRAHLSLEEEEAFLAPFFQQAEKGGILIVTEIHKTYEQAFEKKVFLSVIYDMLHRHGWRKIAPRPAHPKGNTTDQEIFKISFPPQGISSRSRGSGKRASSTRHVSG